MRELIGLYRGKRIDNGEWVEGNIVTPNELYAECYITSLDYLNEHGEIGIVCREVDPDTVGECTGLRDKNGKLAYEHDITEDGWGRRWRIFACEGGFGIRRNSEWSRNDPIYNALADAQNAAWFKENHKIIGNIHDNPELLKGGEGDG